MNLMLAISYFLHLIATVAWIGGLLLLVVVAWPAARTALQSADQSGGLLRLLADLRKRFTPIANLSLIVLIVTGLVQMSANPKYDGLLKIDNDWSRAIFFKHIAVVGMIGVGGVMQLALLPALDRAELRARLGKDAPDLPRLQRRERRLSAFNLALGVLVLAFTAIATAL